MTDAQQIRRADMLTPLLDADPSFRPTWEALLEEWKEEPEPPVYFALSELARHLIDRLARQETHGFEAVFAVVERWHVEGEHYVQEAATIGLLEALQNENLHRTTRPSQFERWLGPQSRVWWDKLNEFWDKGTPLAP